MTKNEVSASNINDTPLVVKKRGRKSKKDIENAAILLQQTSITNNINVVIEESPKDTNIDNIDNIDNLLNSPNIISTEYEEIENIVSENITFFSKDNIQNEEPKPVGKKRGRKPKGGKIIQQAVSINNNKEDKPNVILHLKCSFKDLQTNSLINNEIHGFNFNNANQLSYDVISGESNIYSQNFHDEGATCVQPKMCEDDIDYDDDNSNKDNNIREVWKKLKTLEHNLHINNICDKKSACFWCTYEFDNPPVYIPKHFIKDSYHVYGCFCSPECATAYLMEECIDSSSKFERYHLMNHIYSKIYDYKKNIKPAPNPYYMLDKYYGNLTIQEYRSLLRNERLFLIVDKPLTRILPELHEDNDDFIINNKIIPSNTYQIKKKLQKKQTKTNILSEKFGLLQQSI
jgi:hypothetical protein